MNDSSPSPRSGECLTDAHFPELPGFYRGKVRDNYHLPDGRRVMIATDRQSAFDKVLAAVPHKGRVLNQTAKFWFEATADICPNHVLSYPDPNVVIARHLEMMPIEMIVRDYMTGSTETSIWTMYQRGERLLYGHQFADGLVKNQKLPGTVLTPTTKGERDAPITAAPTPPKRPAPRSPTASTAAPPIEARSPHPAARSPRKLDVRPGCAAPTSPTQPTALPVPT